MGLMLQEFAYRRTFDHGSMPRIDPWFVVHRTPMPDLL